MGQTHQRVVFLEGSGIRERKLTDGRLIKSRKENKKGEISDKKRTTAFSKIRRERGRRTQREREKVRVRN
jgi:hypothetical protein